jgi:hypothetical protein
MRKIVLLLTATVNVADVVRSERRNRELRLHDYCLALDHWLSVKTIDRVIFCENSGVERASILPPAKDPELAARLEFLSYVEKSSPPTRGKAYGELRILQHAIGHSQLLQPDDILFKVTGRYFVKNAEALLRQVEALKDVDIVCDLQQDLTFADARAFFASVRFVESHLLPLIEQADDFTGRHMEYVLAKAVHSAMAQGCIWHLPCEALDVVGYSGTFGFKLKRSLVRRQVKSLMFGTKRWLLER